MIYIAKACVELIVAIILIVALLATKEETTKTVYKLTIAITVLSVIAGITWWFI